MALVRVRGTSRVLAASAEIEAMLGEHGIRYRRWDVRAGDPLLAYEREIRGEYEAMGYVTADVVSLGPENPKLAEICARFDKEHTHDDDEVRFIASGHGTFTVRGVDGAPIDITMGAGDYISVPKDRRHWFTLLADRRVVAVRLFKDHSGWTPRYVGTGTGATEIPSEALRRAFGVTV